MDRPPHALVVGMPQLGHWGPIKILFLKLAREKVSLTILCTRERLAELEGLKKDGAFAGVKYVEFWDVFNDTGSHIFPMINEMRRDILGSPSIKEKLISHISSGHGPTFLVADMFLSWTQDLADESGIPRYVFYTSPTTVALLTLHTTALLADEEKWRARPDDNCDYPGLEEFRYRDIPDGVYYAKEYTSIHFESFIKTAGILVNSFEQVETAQADALRSGLESLFGVAKGPKVFLIGPLSDLPPFGDSHSRKESAPKADNSACLSFLDTQPATSVLYICFGSREELDQASVNDLARALELSNVPFLWALPQPTFTGKGPQSLLNRDVDELLPAGFRSRTKGKGLVWIGWAPQEEILDHPSVGGFLSHCGWNSCLDTIRAGVPIICWPQGADQTLNARFMSHVAKGGIQLENTDNGDAKSNEIAKAIHMLMKSVEGENCRKTTQQLKKYALASVQEGGSSHKAFQEFVQGIRRN